MLLLCSRQRRQSSLLVVSIHLKLVTRRHDTLYFQSDCLRYKLRVLFANDVTGSPHQLILLLFVLSTGGFSRPYSRASAEKTAIVDRVDRSELHGPEGKRSSADQGVAGSRRMGLPLAQPVS